MRPRRCWKAPRAGAGGHGQPKPGHPSRATPTTAPRGATKGTLPYKKNNTVICTIQPLGNFNKSVTNHQSSRAPERSGEHPGGTGQAAARALGTHLGSRSWVTESQTLGFTLGFRENRRLQRERETQRAGGRSGAACSRGSAERRHSGLRGSSSQLPTAGAGAGPRQISARGQDAEAHGREEVRLGARKPHPEPLPHPNPAPSHCSPAAPLWGKPPRFPKTAQHKSPPQAVMLQTQTPLPPPHAGCCRPDVTTPGCYEGKKPHTGLGSSTAPDPPAPRVGAESPSSSSGPSKAPCLSFPIAPRSARRSSLQLPGTIYDFWSGATAKPRGCTQVSRCAPK